MDGNSISEIMLKDHKIIIQLLEDVDKSDHPDIEAFYRFDWHLNKHIFVEEKAVFTSLNYIDKSNYEKLFTRLSKEHTIIIDLLTKILKDLFPKGNINFNKLKKLLSNHRSFEEEKIYPLLEKNLNDEEKNNIIIKIKDII